MTAPDTAATPAAEIGPVTLTGRLVRLEPLSHDHHDELVEAVQDGRQWELWYTAVPTPEGMAAEIDRRLALQEAGSMVPFATRRLSDGQVIGMTTFMNIDRSVPRVEVGSTWNAASASGTGTNADAKLLLLGHAFEVWGVAAVEFRTDWMNMQSRAAIERLGAKRDGVLRQQAQRNGYVRDTVVYSVVAAEWPAVRKGLEFRVGRRAQK
ncbi:GNAT family N-acetyltransferase [Micrococcus sp. EYE_162]|uniref:GNAT family N-acetyltransferase n=1 Tax=unclassified Micrococcus TaxID=2620948 RepID=UPI002006CA88|nr:MULTISPECIES: GNAT family protein [unclassified Micrococcus]MCK6096154.1 GNAT family N-acetyltransferase [Micrococcus sp. EYE_212]MCK6172245.1 GNAT family N-acetyltransferase [Micrococcus sp. EYE_162]